MEARNNSIQNWINRIEVTQVKYGDGPKRGSNSPPDRDSAIQDLPKGKPKKINAAKKNKKNQGKNAAMEAGKNVIPSDVIKREMKEESKYQEDSKEKESTTKSSSMLDLHSKLGKRLNVQAVKMSPKNTVMAHNSAVRILNEEPLVIAPAPRMTREVEEQVSNAAVGIEGAVRQTAKVPNPLELQPCTNDSRMPKNGNLFRKRKLPTSEKGYSTASKQSDDIPKAKDMKLNVAKTIGEQGESATRNVEMSASSAGESKFQRREPGGESLDDQDRREPLVLKNWLPHISLKKAKKNKIMKKVKDHHNKNKLPPDDSTGSEKRVRFADKRQNWLLEGLGGTRDLSKPKKWISSYKIPKVKKGEDSGESGSGSPPSSSDSDKENASPLERVSIFKKSSNYNNNNVNVEVGSDRNCFQRPNGDLERESDDFKRANKAKKRVRWREPLVRVIRISRERSDRPSFSSRPAGRSSLHNHREQFKLSIRLYCGIELQKISPWLLRNSAFEVGNVIVCLKL